MLLLLIKERKTNLDDDLLFVLCNVFVQKFPEDDTLSSFANNLASVNLVSILESEIGCTINFFRDNRFDC